MLCITLLLSFFVSRFVREKKRTFANTVPATETRTTHAQNSDKHHTHKRHDDSDDAEFAMHFFAVAVFAVSMTQGLSLSHPLPTSTSSMQS